MKANLKDDTLDYLIVMDPLDHDNVEKTTLLLAANDQEPLLEAPMIKKTLNFEDL
jgi:hypothetical protein